MVRVFSPQIAFCPFYHLQSLCICFELVWCSFIFVFAHCCLIQTIKSFKGLPLTLQLLGVNWCRFSCVLFISYFGRLFVQRNEQQHWRRCNRWTITPLVPNLGTMHHFRSVCAHALWRIKVKSQRIFSFILSAERLLQQTHRRISWARTKDVVAAFLRRLHLSVQL